MDQEYDISLSSSETSDDITCEIKIGDDALHGHPAVIEIARIFHVRISDPLHTEQVLAKEHISSLQQQQTISISRAKIAGYGYKGRDLDIGLEARLIVQKLQTSGYTKPRQQRIKLVTKDRREKTESEAVINAPDSYDVFANFAAISNEAKFQTGGLIVLAGLTMFAIIFLVLRGSVFNSSSPIFSWPVLLVIVLFAVVSATPLIKRFLTRQFKQYMQFEFSTPKPRLDRNMSISLRSLVDGTSRIDLENTVVRVVACNMECGQYTKGSGTSLTTVKFRKPRHAMILCEQKIARIPKGEPLRKYLTRRFSFNRVYEELLPRQMSRFNDYGVDLHWEVQLLHEGLVDQKLIGSVQELKPSDFAEKDSYFD